MDPSGRLVRDAARVFRREERQEGARQGLYTGTDRSEP
jgi:hypothetical protein